MRGWQRIPVAAGAALALAGGVPSLAADAAAGRKLVEAQCTGCHGTEAYTAPGRKMTSLGALRKQVAACAEAAKAGWSDAQQADVVRYLNDEFYRFP